MVSAIVFQVPSGTCRLLAGTARKSNASLIVLRTSGPCCSRTMNTRYVVIHHHKHILVYLAQSVERASRFDHKEQKT